VAIDILWIQMQRMGEQEHRYFERVELMDLITKLQPRNPEAWAYMGWDCAYNIANQYRTVDDYERLRELEADLRRFPERKDELHARKARVEKRIQEKDKQYRIWVRKGLLKFAEGCRHLPDDAYLKYEVGKALWTKAAWSNGILEEQFLLAVEQDEELQRVLGEGLEPKTRTSFELAEAWFRKGKLTLEQMVAQGRFRVYRTLAESMSRPPEEDRRHHTTQMGLNIDLAAFVGFISEVNYLNGVLHWYRARDAADAGDARRLLLKAAEQFRRAAEHASLYRREHSTVKEGIRAFHDARRDLCDGLAGLCEDLAGLPHPLPADERPRILKRLEQIWWNPVDRNAPPNQQVPPPDERYVLDYMGRLKRLLGGDLWEYNDDRHALHRGNLILLEETVIGDIVPDKDDVDWHHYYAAPAPGQKEGKIVTEFLIQRTGTVALQVIVLALDKSGYAPVANIQLTDAKESRYRVTSDHEGPVILRIFAVAPPDESTPKDRGYALTPVRIRR
jgi:hypothetical protein